MFAFTRAKNNTCVAEAAARHERRSRAFWAVMLMLAFIITVCVLDAYRCEHRFIVAKYELPTPKVAGEIRIAMVGDLHESEFGEANSRLIAAVRELEPDLILCTGDMITRTVADDKLHIGLDFMAEMVKIAPTYMSIGNHEDIYVQNHGCGILDSLEASGVVILEERFVDVSVRGSTLRIGGISDYCFNYGQTQEEYEASEKFAFFNELCDTGSYTILLSHRPTAYRLNSEMEHYEDWPLDLVLAGHTHGGLWRIPFIGCPYLPQQGLFPQLDHGLVDVGNANMIITAGLGSEPMLKRINDPCELVSIKLVPQP